MLYIYQIMKGPYIYKIVIVSIFTIVYYTIKLRTQP